MTKVKSREMRKDHARVDEHSLSKMNLSLRGKLVDTILAITRIDYQKGHLGKLLSVSV